MDSRATSPTRTMNAAAVPMAPDRAAAEQALETAQRNPILSAQEACAIAQVHALLAIERRLGQLFAALVTPSMRDEPLASDPALALFP